MILLDSSFLVAYANKVDANHEKAYREMENIERGVYGTPAITDYVFDEVVTVVLARTKDAKATNELGEKLVSATTMLRIDEDIFRLAWELFKGQERPVLSFTDCTNIATCKINGISSIATFDEDLRSVGWLKVVGPSQEPPAGTNA